MLSREEYEDHFKSEIDEIKHQIEKLALTKKNDDLFVDLEEKERKARMKLRELRSSSQDNWNILKTELENFYDDLNRAISRFH